MSSPTIHAKVRATVQFRHGVQFASDVSAPLVGRSIASFQPSPFDLPLSSIETELIHLDEQDIRITVSFTADFRLPDGLSLDAVRDTFVQSGSVPVWTPSPSGWAQWSAANAAYGIFRNIAERIGLQAAQPAVVGNLERFSNTPDFMALEASLDDPQLVPIKTEVSVYSIDRIGVRGQVVEKQGLEFALAVGPTSQAQRFVLLADRARGELSFAPVYVFVSSLTTAMEVGCYAAWRDANPGMDPPNFNPTDYLTLKGRPASRLVRNGQVFAEHSPQDALICDELWGTRHEVLHNGKQLVRASGSKTNTVPYTDAHANAFRAAVMSLLSWLA